MPTVTTMKDVINPQVMGDMIEAKIDALAKLTPYAKGDTTLEGTAGDTKTVPSWKYIGDAEDFDVEEASKTDSEIMTTNLSATSIHSQLNVLLNQLEFYRQLSTQD